MAIDLFANRHPSLPSFLRPSPSHRHHVHVCIHSWGCILDAYTYSSWYEVLKRSLLVSEATRLLFAVLRMLGTSRGVFSIDGVIILLILISVLYDSLDYNHRLVLLSGQRLATLLGASFDYTVLTRL